LNLLAVTQFFVGSRYNGKKEAPLRDRLRALLGGREVMIESPIYQEIVEESERRGESRARQRDILDVLGSRFGAAAKDLEVELRTVEFDRLSDLVKIAAKCRSLASFRKHLLS
jgi:hypothetical protein